jgi:hypothetical protein
VSCNHSRVICLSLRFCRLRWWQFPERDAVLMSGHAALQDGCCCCCYEQNRDDFDISQAASSIITERRAQGGSVDGDVKMSCVKCSHGIADAPRCTHSRKECFFFLSTVRLPLGNKGLTHTDDLPPVHFKSFRIDVTTGTKSPDSRSFILSVFSWTLF